jgi:hypothetical protein
VVQVGVADTIFQFELGGQELLDKVMQVEMVMQHLIPVVVAEVLVQPALMVQMDLILVVLVVLVATAVHQV